MSSVVSFCCLQFVPANTFKTFFAGSSILIIGSEVNTVTEDFGAYINGEIYPSNKC